MPSNQLSFKVIDNYCKEFATIEKIFNDLILPIYGDQTSAIEKIAKGRDRLCEGLFDGEHLKGIIVYKKALIDENLELKTLCLIDHLNDNKKGLGFNLIERVIDIAHRRNAKNILVTVSSQSNALGFFQKYGFETTKSEKNKYNLGGEEYTLVRPTSLTCAYKPKAISEPNTYNDRNQYNISPSSNYKDKPLSCTLKKQYVQAIASGRKTHEGRVNTDFFRKYQPGKLVTWFAGNESSVQTKILNRQEFHSFDAMLKEIGFKAFIPEARSFEEAKRIYDNIPGYAEKVQKYGALALEVKPLKPEETQQLQQFDRKRNFSDVYQSPEKIENSEHKKQKRSLMFSQHPYETEDQAKSYPSSQEEYKSANYSAMKPQIRPY